MTESVIWSATLSGSGDIGHDAVHDLPFLRPTGRRKARSRPSLLGRDRHRGRRRRDQASG